MTGAAFEITSITAYGYGDKKNLSGTVKVRHSGTNMQFEVKIGSRECALVFAIIADSVAKMMTEMSIGIRQDIGAQATTLIAAELPDVSNRLSALGGVHNVRTPPDYASGSIERDADGTDHGGTKDTPEPPAVEVHGDTSEVRERGTSTGNDPEIGLSRSSEVREDKRRDLDDEIPF